MELSKCSNLSKQILDNPDERYCEIYKIVNLTTNKIYVGQAVSHILNHGRYRPYGHMGRFKCHISEAFSSKKNQSHYLNNSIRKYGVDDFECELIEYCECNDADEREKYYINKYNSLYPYGYNLKNGGKTFIHTEESKKRVSDGVIKYYHNKKLERFRNVVIDPSKTLDEMIRPLKKYGQQYGWYVWINRVKADFGGTHIDLDTSYKEAVKFIEIVKDKELMATYLDAGNPLEP
jgi:group I intron endonuclease